MNDPQHPTTRIPRFLAAAAALALLALAGCRRSGGEAGAPGGEPSPGGKPAEQQPSGWQVEADGGKLKLTGQRNGPLGGKVYLTNHGPKTYGAVAVYFDIFNEQGTQIDEREMVVLELRPGQRHTFEVRSDLPAARTYWYSRLEGWNN